MHGLTEQELLRVDDEINTVISDAPTLIYNPEKPEVKENSNIDTSESSPLP